jgi:hypothetical protein
MVQLAGAISAVAFLAFGGPNIFQSIVERRDRNEVLARGKSAVATVQQRSGVDSVVISLIPPERDERPKP